MDRENLRREPGNRTPRFLAPNQVRSPSRSFPKPGHRRRQSRRAGCFVYAIRCGVLNVVPCARSVLGHCGAQGRQDSNLQPSVLETDAQPVELRPYEQTKNRPVPVRGGRLEG